MTLATLIFVLTVLMFGLSLVQRRSTRFEPALTWVVRALIAIIPGLTAYYFIVGRPT